MNVKGKLTQKGHIRRDSYEVAIIVAVVPVVHCAVFRKFPAARRLFLREHAAKRVERRTYPRQGRTSPFMFQPIRLGNRPESVFFGKRLDSSFRRPPSMKNRPVGAGGMSGYFNVSEAVID